MKELLKALEDAQFDGIGTKLTKFYTHLATVMPLKISNTKSGDKVFLNPADLASDDDFNDASDIFDLVSAFSTKQERIRRNGEVSKSGSVFGKNGLGVKSVMLGRKINGVWIDEETGEVTLSVQTPVNTSERRTSEAVQSSKEKYLAEMRAKVEETKRLAVEAD